MKHYSCVQKYTVVTQKCTPMTCSKCNSPTYNLDLQQGMNIFCMFINFTGFEPHLMFPLCEITPYRMPRLAEAVRHNAIRLMQAAQIKLRLKEN